MKKISALFLIITTHSLLFAQEASKPKLDNIVDQAVILFRALLNETKKSDSPMSFLETRRPDKFAEALESFLKTQLAGGSSPVSIANTITPYLERMKPEKLIPSFKAVEKSMPEQWILLTKLATFLPEDSPERNLFFENLMRQSQSSPQSSCAKGLYFFSRQDYSPAYSLLGASPDCRKSPQFFFTKFLDEFKKGNEEELKRLVFNPRLTKHRHYTFIHALYNFYEGDDTAFFQFMTNPKEQESFPATDTSSLLKLLHLFSSKQMARLINAFSTHFSEPEYRDQIPKAGKILITHLNERTQLSLLQIFQSLSDSNPFFYQIRTILAGCLLKLGDTRTFSQLKQTLTTEKHSDNVDFSCAKKLVSSLEENKGDKPTLKCIFPDEILNPGFLSQQQKSPEHNLPDISKLNKLDLFLAKKPSEEDIITFLDQLLGKESSAADFSNVENKLTDDFKASELSQWFVLKRRLLFGLPSNRPQLIETLAQLPLLPGSESQNTASQFQLWNRNFSKVKSYSPETSPQSLTATFFLALKNQDFKQASGAIKSMASNIDQKTTDWLLSLFIEPASFPQSESFSDQMRQSELFYYSAEIFHALPDSIRVNAIHQILDHLNLCPVATRFLLLETLTQFLNPDSLNELFLKLSPANFDFWIIKTAIALKIEAHQSSENVNDFKTVLLNMDHPNNPILNTAKALWYHAHSQYSTADNALKRPHSALPVLDARNTLAMAVEKESSAEDIFKLILQFGAYPEYSILSANLIPAAKWPRLIAHLNSLSKTELLKIYPRLKAFSGSSQFRLRMLDFFAESGIPVTWLQYPSPSVTELNQSKNTVTKARFLLGQSKFNAALYCFKELKLPHTLPGVLESMFLASFRTKDSSESITLFNKLISEFPDFDLTLLKEALIRDGVVVPSAVQKVWDSSLDKAKIDSPTISISPLQSDHRRKFFNQISQITEPMIQGRTMEIAGVLGQMQSRKEGFFMEDLVLTDDDVDFTANTLQIDGNEKAVQPILSGLFEYKNITENVTSLLCKISSKYQLSLSESCNKKEKITVEDPYYTALLYHKNKVSTQGIFWTLQTMISHHEVLFPICSDPKTVEKYREYFTSLPKPLKAELQAQIAGLIPPTSCFLNTMIEPLGETSSLSLETDQLLSLLSQSQCDTHIATSASPKLIQRLLYFLPTLSEKDRETMLSCLPIEILQSHATIYPIYEYFESLMAALKSKEPTSILRLSNRVPSHLTYFSPWNFNGFDPGSKAKWLEAVKQTDLNSLHIFKEAFSKTSLSNTIKQDLLNPVLDEILVREAEEANELSFDEKETLKAIEHQNFSQIPILVASLKEKRMGFFSVIEDSTEMYENLFYLRFIQLYLSYSKSTREKILNSIISYDKSSPDVALKSRLQGILTKLQNTTFESYRPILSNTINHNEIQRFAYALKNLYAKYDMEINAEPQKFQQFLMSLNPYLKNSSADFLREYHLLVSPFLDDKANFELKSMLIQRGAPLAVQAQESTSNSLKTTEAANQLALATAREAFSKRNYKAAIELYENIANKENLIDYWIARLYYEWPLLMPEDAEVYFQKIKALNPAYDTEKLKKQLMEY